MLHSIVSILTAMAVAIHAMLGCCAHHAHACDSHEPGPMEVIAAAETLDGCAQSHHSHHGEDDDSPSNDLTSDCGHDHDGGDRRECEEGDCNFTSVQRSNDLELMLTFSMWLQTLGKAIHTDALDRLLSRRAVTETPPDLLMNSGSARAFSQIWRL